MIQYWNDTGFDLHEILTCHLEIHTEIEPEDIAVIKQLALVVESVVCNGQRS